MFNIPSKNLDPVVFYQKENNDLILLNDLMIKSFFQLNDP